jgi:Zn-dependent oligopeptidase
MIEYGNLTPDKVAAGCEQAMRDCDDAIARIVATPAGDRNFANTFGVLETAGDYVGQASGAYTFMAYVALDDALRETAREWDEKLSKYAVDLTYREDLYNAIKQYAESPEAASLEGERKRVLEHTLRDYRRAGRT